MNGMQEVRKEVERELVDIPPDRFTPKGCCFSSVMQFVLVAVLGSFQFGYNMSAFNTAKVFVIADFGWCAHDNQHLLNCSKGVIYGSLVTAGVFIGLVAGCLLAAKVTSLGRKFGLLCTNFVFFCGSAFSAASDGFATLLIGRLLAGLGVGLATVCVPMYISEFTPDATRGFYGALHQLLVTVGIFSGTVVGLLLGSAPLDSNLDFKVTLFHQIWWRVMLALPCTVSLAAILLLWLTYYTESPHYLVAKNKNNTAAALLRELHNKEDVSREMENIERGVCQEKVLDAQSLSIWRAMKFPSYRHVLLLAFAIASLQQLSGINVLVANSNKLYSSLKLSNSLVTGLTVGMNAMNVLMTFPSIFLMDRLGRKTLLSIGTIGQSICIGAALIANCISQESVASRWATVALIYAFVIFFAIGYGAVMWVYLHEIFPPEIKHGGASVASALNGVATILVVLPSDFALTEDLRVLLAIFLVACLAAALISLTLVKETAGLSIDDSPYFKGKARVMSKYFTTTGLNNQAPPVPSLASGFYSVSQMTVPGGNSTHPALQISPDI